MLDRVWISRIKNATTRTMSEDYFVMYRYLFHVDLYLIKGDSEDADVIMCISLLV